MNRRNTGGSTGLSTFKSIESEAARPEPGTLRLVLFRPMYQKGGITATNATVQVNGRGGPRGDVKARLLVVRRFTDHDIEQQREPAECKEYHDDEKDRLTVSRQDLLDGQVRPCRSQTNVMSSARPNMSTSFYCRPGRQDSGAATCSMDACDVMAFSQLRASADSGRSHRSLLDIA